jgi:hypothetical protein
MKHVLILGVIALTMALFAACSGGGGGGEVGRYPQAVKDLFIVGCSEATSFDPDFLPYCHCTLRELEANVSIGEFLALEEDMLNDPDYFPDELSAAILACMDRLPPTEPAPEY